MADLTYNIKISSTAEIRALRDLEESLQRQIVQARVLGQEYTALEQQLARTRVRLGDFNPVQAPDHPQASPEAVAAPDPAGDITDHHETSRTGRAASIADTDSPKSAPAEQPQGAFARDTATPPRLPPPPLNEINGIGEAFAEYHAASTAAFAELKDLITAKTEELKHYVDRRIADVANP